MVQGVPTPEAPGEIGQFFRLLAEPTRLHLLCELRRGPRDVAALVAPAAAKHAMLHGLEAPADGSAALWWLGAFSGSVLVSGGSVLSLRRLPLAWIHGVCVLLALCGGVSALGPIGWLMS